jgi:hypothetical protein
MDIEKTLVEKIKRFEDLKNQLDTLQKQIGGLQEQQRVIYNTGLELKGQIDMLMELRAKEAADKKGLVLPDKSLVAPDGKTVIATPTDTPVTPEKPAEVTPTVLEVK